jgi:hypothetical protein
MAVIDGVLEATNAAVANLVLAAEARADAWTVPRAPGKWSPSQLVEHVARSLEESANEVAGVRSKFPNLPFFLKPVARMFLFNRVLKNGTFPRARTSRPFNPDAGPATPAEARQRLEFAARRFDAACRARAAKEDEIATTVFGVVKLSDYARFQEIHTRHHTKQMQA